MLSSSVFRDFENDYAPHHIDIMMKRLLDNQTVHFVTPSDAKFNRFEGEQEVQDYLAHRSSKYVPIEVRELARGGEAVVYRVEHSNLEEVVAKCTLGSGGTDAFLDLMQETHSLKLLKNRNLICEVKEEIIEIEQGTNRIINYCVVVEQA